MPPRGRVGVLAESGLLSASLIEHAVRTELGLSTFVAAGNRADVSGNDLLQYHMISDACASGCRSYHMGESGGVETLERFKALFGAKACSYAEYVHERLPITAATETAERILSRAASVLSK